MKRVRNRRLEINLDCFFVYLGLLATRLMIVCWHLGVETCSGFIELFHLFSSSFLCFHNCPTWMLFFAHFSLCICCLFLSHRSSTLLSLWKHYFSIILLLSRHKLLLLSSHSLSTLLYAPSTTPLNGLKIDSKQHSQPPPSYQNPGYYPSMGMESAPPPAYYPPGQQGPPPPPPGFQPQGVPFVVPGKSFLDIDLES